MTRNSVLLTEAFALLQDKNIPAAQQCIAQITRLTPREGGDILTELLVNGNDAQKVLAGTAMVVGLRQVLKQYMDDLNTQREIARALGVPLNKPAALNEPYDPANDEDGNGWKKGG